MRKWVVCPAALLVKKVKQEKSITEDNKNRDLDCAWFYTNLEVCVRQ